MTDNMKYIHVKLQDLQQNAGWNEGRGRKITGMGKI